MNFHDAKVLEQGDTFYETHAHGCIFFPKALWALLSILKTLNDVESTGSKMLTSGWPGWSVKTQITPLPIKSYYENFLREPPRCKTAQNFRDLPTETLPIQDQSKKQTEAC